mmetsp:Transcript_4655/g.8763  ORF Transcript_4655/g.8763 Transcript_4655/m.8763 type:complete len:277 (+) Transcript_4655:322-1152(+)
MIIMKVWRKDVLQLIEIPRSDVLQLIEIPRSDVLHPAEEVAMTLTESATVIEKHLAVQVVTDPLKELFEIIPEVGIMMEVSTDLRNGDVNPHVVTVVIVMTIMIDERVVSERAAEIVEIVAIEVILIDERVATEETAEIVEKVAIEATVASVIEMKMTTMMIVTKMCAVLGTAMSGLPERVRTPVAPGRLRRDLCHDHTTDLMEHPPRQPGVVKATTVRNSLKRKIDLLIEVGTHGHPQSSIERHHHLCEVTIGVKIPMRNSTDALRQCVEMSPRA